MESPEEFSGSNDHHHHHHHHHILKGKRTKRQRSSSPMVTEEDEDMANCLILLAHSSSPYQESVDNIIITKKNCNPQKIMYECKTCDRSFHTFQALGGHRASHKRPKSIVMKLLTPQIMDQELAEEGKYGNIKQSKVHECSICGSEFSSGQALGGHMRRHRTTTSSVITESTSELTREDERERSVLSLDLNLPAPEDDYYRESVFGFTPNNQNLVFSASALVGCQY